MKNEVIFKVEETYHELLLSFERNQIKITPEDLLNFLYISKSLIFFLTSEFSWWAAFGVLAGRMRPMGRTLGTTVLDTFSIIWCQHQWGYQKT